MYTETERASCLHNSATSLLVVCSLESNDFCPSISSERSLKIAEQINTIKLLIHLITYTYMYVHTHICLFCYSWNSSINMYTYSHFHFYCVYAEHEHVKKFLFLFQKKVYRVCVYKKLIL